MAKQQKHPDFPHKTEFLSLDQAVKIKCKYCDIKDICPLRAQKETYEDAGWTTRCIVTPNRPGKKRKARVRKQKQAK